MPVTPVLIMVLLSFLSSLSNHLYVAPLLFVLKIPDNSRAVEVHTFNPSTREAETDGSL